MEHCLEIIISAEKMNQEGKVSDPLLDGLRRPLEVSTPDEKLEIPSDERGRVQAELLLRTHKIVVYKVRQLLRLIHYDILKIFT